MSIVTVPVTDIRQNIRAVLATLDKPVFVTQRGRVKAVLLDIAAYNRLLDRLEDALDAADPETRQDAADAVTAYERGETVPLEVVMKEHGLLSSRNHEQGQEAV